MFYSVIFIFVRYTCAFLSTNTRPLRMFKKAKDWFLWLKWIDFQVGSSFKKYMNNANYSIIIKCQLDQMRLITFNRIFLSLWQFGYCGTDLSKVLDRLPLERQKEHGIFYNLTVLRVRKMYSSLFWRPFTRNEDVSRLNLNLNLFTLCIFNYNISAAPSLYNCKHS